MSQFSFNSHHHHHHDYNKKDQDRFGNFQLRNYAENVICSSMTPRKITNILDTENNIQIYQFNDHDENSDAAFDSVDSEEHETINESIILNKDENRKNNASNSVVVPTLSNVDDIFQLLSQKIAKYCQVLADLTNCEVFYKAQLPLNLDTTHDEKKQFSKSAKSSKPKSETNKNMIRSLYWGTHQMLFEYSHNDGLKYNKAMGECLIKINNRSMTNDVSSLIEEILNEPNLNFSNGKNSDKNSEGENYSDSEIIEINQESCRTMTMADFSNQDVEIKDCVVKLNRLDESIFNQYLNKFESYNNKINDKRHLYEHDLGIPDDIELYSDKNRLRLEKINSKNESSVKSIFLNDSNNSIESNIEFDEENEDEDDDEDLDEKALLVKNCFDYNQNEEEYYSCEYCKNHLFKHLTQLKIHELRVHQNVIIPDETNECCYRCTKCNSSFLNRIEYLKHVLLCYYPDIYSCKTCKLSFSNYSQYLFHSKFVHTNVVYMCSICGRKYREIKDLLDHDHLMHSKSYIYCEICFEQLKSRKKLLEHYKLFHLNGTDNNSQEILETINHSRIKSSDNNQIDDFVSGSYTKKKDSNIFTLNEQTSIVTDKTDKSPSDKINSDVNNLNTSKNLNQSSNTTTSSTSSTWNKIQKNDLIRGLIDRKHQCKWCSLRFYTKSQLKQHETTHTNSVLYCPVCDKEFTHKDRLSGHMKCHMEPSLECKVCGKKFKRLCNLYNHELVHGLTEHAFMLCQFCGRGFRSRRDYQNHVIANHRDQLMKSDSSELNQLEANSKISTNDQNKKNGKRSLKSQARKIDETINLNSTNQIERAFESTRTTTVILSDDYINLSDENELINNKNKNNNANDNEVLETETYFTRTQIEKNEIDEIEQQNEIEDDGSDENFGSQYIGGANEIKSNINNITNNNANNNAKQHFRNKMKRLKISLDVEVFDDDDNHDTHNISNASRFATNSVS